MSSQEPPRHVWYELEEVLDLLATLEDVRDALLRTGHLTAVLGVEHQVRLLSRRLDLGTPEGGADEQ